MQLKFTFFAFLCLLVAYSSCTSDGSDSPKTKPVDYKILSEELCKCAQPSILLQEEMEALNKAKKKEELKALFPKAGKTFNKVLECTKDYMFSRNVVGLEKDKLKAELLKQCNGMSHKMVGEIILKI